MRFFNPGYLILFFCLTFFACANHSDLNDKTWTPMRKESPVKFGNEEKILEYVNNETNGYIKSKTIGSITYYGVLKPFDFLLAQERLKQKNNNLQRKDFENLQYFDLRIKVNGTKQEFIKHELESVLQYKQRVNYCAFEMQNDIKLIDGKDTLNCVLFHFERGFDIISYGHFILGFENHEGEMVNPKGLIFNDRLFNNGTIKFMFHPGLLVKEPVLL